MVFKSLLKIHLHCEKRFIKQYLKLKYIVNKDYFTTLAWMQIFRYLVFARRCLQLDDIYLKQNITVSILSKMWKSKLVN